MSRCRPCVRAYAKTWYEKNREKRIGVAKETRYKIAKLVEKIKTSNPCLDCGRKFHHCAMDFDHREGEEKNADISVLVRRRGILKVLAEIKKCDLVCAVCHRIRGYKRQFPDREPTVL